MPWLAPLLDAGKPTWMVRAQRDSKQRRSLPRIMRPDLLWCESGLRLTEIDSVPGGLGILHFLHQLHTQNGHGAQLIGGTHGITEGFQHAYPDGALIAISEESSDYRPEMEYLLSHLPSELYRSCAAEQLRVSETHDSCLYRFFELFDHENIDSLQQLTDAWAQDRLCMDPPPLPHLEEKAWLALFHLPGLQEWWRCQLRATHREKLHELIPRSWLLDPTPLPPHASLPWLSINDWRDLAKLSQKQRRLVVKISGFDERAWGARGVYIGHDMPSNTWSDILHHAHADFPNKLWIMQEYCHPRLIEHAYSDDDGTITPMRGRVRLCPYYATDPSGKETRLIGCLATIAAEDKKKIHGMKNSILAPCIFP